MFPAAYWVRSLSDTIPSSCSTLLDSVVVSRFCATRRVFFANPLQRQETSRISSSAKHTLFLPCRAAGIARRPHAMLATYNHARIIRLTAYLFLPLFLCRRTILVSLTKSPCRVPFFASLDELCVFTNSAATLPLPWCLLSHNSCHLG